MIVLVLNCGSSSIKYQLLEMKDETLIAKGLVERIGMEGSVITHEKTGHIKIVKEVPMKDHKDGIKHVMDALLAPDGGLKSLKDIDAIGHRIVHAGEKYSNSILISDTVVAALEECIDLAPLHNPPNLDGIQACKELMPGVPMVGVFDTADRKSVV